MIGLHDVGALFFARRERGFARAPVASPGVTHWENSLVRHARTQPVRATAGRSCRRTRVLGGTPNRRARTAPARDAFLAKFEDLVDPDHELHPQERARRAGNARRAHFTRLALRSAQARQSAGVQRQALQELREVAELLESAAGDDLHMRGTSGPPASGLGHQTDRPAPATKGAVQ